MSTSTSRRWSRPLLISMGSAAVALIAQWFGILEPLEGFSYNWRMNLTRSGTHTNPQVAVVLIDDNSIKTLEPVVGRWPWPRSIYADLLDYLSLGEPAAVMFDVTFHEKHRTDLSDRLDEHDARLVEATANYPFTYHASRFLVDEEDVKNKNILNRSLPPELSAETGVKKRFGLTDDALNLNAPSNNVYYLPFKELLAVSKNLGSVDVNPDNDGVYRRARLFHRYQDDLFPALSITAWLDQKQPTRIRRTDHRVALDDVELPVDDHEQFLINYYTAYDTFSFGGLIASSQQIQQGNLENLLVNPEIFKGKYIFIGGSAAGTEDLKVTPINNRLPGVMVHASILSNILDNTFLTPPQRWLTNIFVLLISLVTAFGVLTSKKSWQQNIIPLVTLVTFTSWSIFEFSQFIVIEMVAPIVAGMTAWTSSFSLLIFTEGKEKRKFKRMMSQYLSPAVLDTVINNKEEFGRAEIGRKETISILFSDIRGFTTLSEQLPAEKVVEILNYYFSNMTEAIFRHEGTIDKFIGDAIMAFWGAPIRIANHADKSVATAIAMIEKLQEVNNWLSAHQYANIAIGIGINTGDVILGNIGSEHKLDYTIIGDNVNLASRMEGLTKSYQSPILITENTRKLLQNPLPCRIVDLVKVKGKQHPIKIYQPITPVVVTLPETLTAERLAEIAERAFSHYLKQEWRETLKLCDEMPNDYATNLLRERCAYYESNPPSPDWDGAFTMKTK